MSWDSGKLKAFLYLPPPFQAGDNGSSDVILYQVWHSNGSSDVKRLEHRKGPLRIGHHCYSHHNRFTFTEIKADSSGKDEGESENHLLSPLR